MEIGRMLPCGAARFRQERPFLPSLAAAVKPAMNDIVFHELAWQGRSEVEVEGPVEFHLCRLTVRGNEIRDLQKFDCFLQSRVI